MSITFNDRISADDYKKRKEDEGYLVKIDKQNNNFVATIKGKSSVIDKRFAGKSWAKNIKAPIDEDIVDLIIVLNDRDYTTRASCSGHYKKKMAAGNYMTEERGFISFNQKLSDKEKENVKNIAKSLGFTNITLTDEPIENTIKTTMDFDAPWTKRK